jgi:hypothetical protein
MKKPHKDSRVRQARLMAKKAKRTVRQRENKRETRIRNNPKCTKGE